jgi:cation diffusion facilitator family transporter
MSSGHGSPAKAILYAFIANFGIAVTKGGAAIYTNSGSMLAEAIHSVADCLNQVLLYIGLRGSERPPTMQHPLGYGKSGYFWSFIVALMLFSMGGLFSIYEGWHKLAHPEPLQYAWVAVAVLVFGLAAEVVSLRACLHEVNKVRGSRSLWQWFRHSRQSELVVILGEDLAALLGLALALFAVILTILTGNPVWDAWGSIAIGAVLVIVAIGIAIEIKGLLIGQSAEPELEARMRTFLEKRGEVDKIYAVLTLQLGTSLMVSVKVCMKAQSARDLVGDINRCEVAMRAEFPEIQWLFFEPDVKD